MRAQIWFDRLDRLPPLGTPEESVAILVQLRKTHVKTAALNVVLAGTIVSQFEEGLKHLDQMWDQYLNEAFGESATAEGTSSEDRMMQVLEDATKKAIRIEIPETYDAEKNKTRTLSSDTRDRIANAKAERAGGKLVSLDD